MLRHVCWTNTREDVNQVICNACCRASLLKERQRREEIEIERKELERQLRKYEAEVQRARNGNFSVFVYCLSAEVAQVGVMNYH